VLPKVTDRHVRPGVQSKMKVNLAAQIMSSSVVAIFSVLLTTGKYNCIVSEWNVNLLAVVLQCAVFFLSLFCVV
jgi:hypothetical protein